MRSAQLSNCTSKNLVSFLGVRLTREHLGVQVLAGRVITGSSFAPQLHTHPEWELTLIRRGNGTRLVGDMVRPFQAGEFVLLADKHLGSPVPATARAITALLREARSLSRRADKLSATAAAVADLTTQQLAAEASTGVQHLVHHLTVLERQLQRHEKQPVRRGR